MKKAGTLVTDVMRKFLKKIPLVGPGLKWLIHLSRDARSIRWWLLRLLDASPKTVIQVGANDGARNDPIHQLLLARPEWDALLVEPVPHLNEELRRNYAHRPGILFSDHVINGGESGSFYWLRPEVKDHVKGFPAHGEGLASINKQHLISYLGATVEPYIEETEFKGCTLPGLMQEFGIGKCHLVVVDTEGFDWKVIRTLNWDTERPQVIVFEQKHLGNGDRHEAYQTLSPFYRLYEFQADVLAVDRRVRIPFWDGCVLFLFCKTWSA